MFPTNATTTFSYIQSGASSTTTILDLAQPATLLYSAIEKGAVLGEVKIIADGRIIDHLDGLEKNTFLQVPFRKLELVRSGLGVNDDSFASFTYIPYSSTTSASSTIYATFTYGEIINSVFLFMLFAVGFYKILK